MTAPSCYFCGQATRFILLAGGRKTAGVIAGPIQPSIISRNQFENVRRKKMAAIANLPVQPSTNNNDTSGQPQPLIVKTKTLICRASSGDLPSVVIGRDSSRGAREIGRFTAGAV
jgi:hypothetical protein